MLAFKPSTGLRQPCVRHGSSAVVGSLPRLTRQRRSPAVLAVMVGASGPSSPAPSRGPRLRTIEAITAAVSIQAQTQRFERLAGRSAMIGVLVAVVAELLTSSSIFRHFTPDTAASLGGLFMGAVSLAAAAAFASKRPIGVDLLEAVVTSLTANQRSAASITGRQVDTAVDNILAKAFDQGVICSMLAPEDEDI